MKIALACILFLFTALSIGSALNESLTYDEVFYLEEGRGILTGAVSRDPYNPPLMPILTGIPSVLGWTTPIAARLVTIGLGTLLVIAVYITGARTFGSLVGLVAAFLLAFDPNVLANSHYVTSDIGVTLFIFLAVVFWMRFLSRPTWRKAVLFAFAVGYAVGAKITSLVFTPAIMVVLLWQEKGYGSWRWVTKHQSKVFVGSVVVLFFLWSMYFFRSDVIIAQRPDENRVSSHLLRLASDREIPILAKSIDILRTVPVPLGGFIALLKNNAIRAITSGEARPPWYRILVTVSVKTPIPLILLFMVSLLFSGQLPEFKKRRLYMFGSLPIIILAASIGLGIAPMVRYVLPMYPFVAIVAAAGIREIGEIRGICGKIAISILLLWYIGGTLVQYPHFISYANELAGPREKRYEILSDSNLDWGQALPDLERYVQKQKIGRVKLSYFGRDDEGEWRFEEICAFHDEVFDPKSKRTATVISVSNWYYCGYNKEEKYRKEYIWDVVADSLLVF